MIRRYTVQTWVEASLFQDKNILLYQYPEKIVARQDIRIVTGYLLDIILDIKAYHQYVQWIMRYKNADIQYTISRI